MKRKRKKKKQNKIEDVVRLLEPLSEVHTVKYAATGDDLHTVNAKYISRRSFSIYCSVHPFRAIFKALVLFFLLFLPFKPPHSDSLLYNAAAKTWFISLINANYEYEQINGNEWQLGYYKISIYNHRKKFAALAFSRWIASSAKISTKTLVVEWLENIKPVRFESNDSFFLNWLLCSQQASTADVAYYSIFLSISISIVHSGKR